MDVQSSKHNGLKGNREETTQMEDIENQLLDNHSSGICYAMAKLC